MNLLKWTGGATVAIALVTGAHSFGTVRDDVGWTKLHHLLGVNVPDGAGVDFSQIEAFNPQGHYMPNAADVQLDVPGRTFNNITNFDTGTSFHATRVMEFAIGDDDGMAPGVLDIDNYNALSTTTLNTNNWIFDTGLRVNSLNAPQVETRDVQFHAWVYDFELPLFPPAYNEEATMRHDFQINRDNFIAVVGVNNGAAGDYVPVLADGYNAISVGITDGSSYRTTGRVRPHIVTSNGVTSYAVGTVGGISAMLIEHARTAPSMANAENNQAMRAILMAGATQADVPGWTRESDTAPLDRQSGAGEINVYNSYLILDEGEQESSVTQDVSSRGFDFDTFLTTDSSRQYFFEITQVADVFRAALSWNVLVEDTGPNAFETFDVQDLNLTLYAASGFTKGALQQESIAPIDINGDNTWTTEFIHLENLAAGRYVLEVTNLTGTANWEYGLAWDSIVPEPASVLLLVSGAGLLVMRRRG